MIIIIDLSHKMLWFQMRSEHISTLSRFSSLQSIRFQQKAVWTFSQDTESKNCGSNLEIFSKHTVSHKRLSMLTTWLPVLSNVIFYQTMAITSLTVRPYFDEHNSTLCPHTSDICMCVWPPTHCHVVWTRRVKRSVFIVYRRFAVNTC